MSVHTLILLRSLMVFDAILALAVGLLIAWCVAAPAVQVRYADGCEAH